MRREKPTKDAIELWRSLGLVEERNRPVANEDNLRRVLEYDPNLQGVVWYDVFHDKIFTTLGSNGELNGHAGEFTDTENLHLLTYLQNHLSIHKAKKTVLFDAVDAHAHANPKNEVKDWMESLVHDGKPRIDTFMSYGMGAKHHMYTRAVSKNFWLSMVARVYKPGCQVDNLVVLEGAQGIGKNRAWRAVGGKWYTQTKCRPDEKDFYLTLQGKLIVEFNELVAVRRSDAEEMKACISCTVDNYRTPYGRVSRDHPRQCVFVGSTNEPFYISDPSGGRRFWPIKCNEENLIDIDYIEQNREQLFAEAVARFKAGETWWEMPEEALEEQEARRITDELETPVKTWSDSHSWDITIADLAADLLEIQVADLDVPMQRRLAVCLRLAGRVKVHTAEGNVWRLNSVKTPNEPSEPTDKNKVQ